MDKTLEELKKDREKLEKGFEVMKEQLIGNQYVRSYLDQKIKELEEKEKPEKEVCEK